MNTAPFKPSDVLDLWFPDTGHESNPETHAAFWEERMQGGMDAVIIRDFGDLTLAAAKGQLDHWAQNPRGRLALLIALDQFPRSLWRDTPAAFSQDIKATRLALEGLENGHFDALAPWEQMFYHIAISHCEGPDHLQRMYLLQGVAETIIEKLPTAIAPMGQKLREQAERVTGIVEQFGRHPHRNSILGRPSTPEEEAYIATGDFPHLPKTQP
jgi:uncharacterized protein (DUF924 family)